MSEPKTIKEMLCESAEKYKNNCAFTFLGKDGKRFEISYERLKNDVDSLSLALIYELKAENEKAAIICHNCYEWCLCYLACLSSGIVAVPVDRELSGSDIGDILSFAEVKVVFCDSKTKEKLQKNPEVSYVEINPLGESEFEKLLKKGEDLKR